MVFWDMICARAARVKLHGMHGLWSSIPSWESPQWDAIEVWHVLAFIGNNHIGGVANRHVLGHEPSNLRCSRFCASFLMYVLVGLQRQVGHRWGWWRTALAVYIHFGGPKGLTSKFVCQNSETSGMIAYWKRCDKCGKCWDNHPTWLDKIGTIDATITR